MGLEFWQDLVAGLVLGTVAYVSTNLDNLLLVSSVAASGSERSHVARGWLVSAFVVLALSIAFTAVAEAVPASSLGWLGLVPLLLGIRLLVLGGDASDGSARLATGTTPIIVLLMSNSTDTIATFGPLLAESEPVAKFAMLAGFTVAALVFVSLVMKLAARLDKASTLSRLAAKLSPLVMIAIGIYILLDTTTDTI